MEHWNKCFIDSIIFSFTFFKLVQMGGGGGGRGGRGGGGGGGVRGGARDK